MSASEFPGEAESARRSRLAALTSTLGVSKFSEGQFLGLLLLLLVTSPLFGELREGRVIEAGLLTVLLISAIVAVGGRKRSLVIATALVIPVLIGKWANHLWPGDVTPAVYLVPGVLFSSFIVGHHLHFILKAGDVDSRVLCAGVSTYLMLGFLWAFVHVLVATYVPDAYQFNDGPPGDRQMHGFTAAYYSLSTLCSAGFGDIVPVARASRMASLIEAMTGTFYMAILLARLVALHTARATR
jgi:hypothetical protein